MKLIDLKPYQILSISDWKAVEQELSALHQYMISTVPHTVEMNLREDPCSYSNPETMSKILELPCDKYTVVSIQKVISDNQRNIELNQRPSAVLFFVETDFSKGFLRDN